jgi:hypothetical protein
MPASGIWRRVSLVKTDVSEDIFSSIFRVQEIHRRRKALAVV